MILLVVIINVMYFVLPVQRTFAVDVALWGTMLTAAVLVLRSSRKGIADTRLATKQAPHDG